MTTRTFDLDWRMRAIQVLPMFVIPALSSIIYYAFINLTHVWESKNRKLLEELRAERQAKIDELKERTNYYTTQHLIQRFLASKLGADSGLKVYLEDETMQRTLARMSKNAEYMQTNRLRNRKQAHKSSSVGNESVHFAQSPEAEMLHGNCHMHNGLDRKEDFPLSPSSAHVVKS